MVHLISFRHIHRGSQTDKRAAVGIWQIIWLSTAITEEEACNKNDIHSINPHY